MRAAAVLLVAVVASCWTEGPGPTPPPRRPDPVAGARPNKPAAGPRWRQSEPVATTPAAPRQTNDELARQLAADLRANGDQLMVGYVVGPMVVLDLDTGNLTVECDAAAATLAANWGLDFTDPKRARPYCRGSQSFTCSQFSAQQILIVEFADPDSWRIVSAIVGNYRSGRSTMGSKMAQMRQMINSATCP